MPFHLDILSSNGDLLKIGTPAMDQEAVYVRSYQRRRLVSIIAGESRDEQGVGIIHIVRDPTVIAAIKEGDVEVSGVLGDETATTELPPDDSAVELPFTSRRGILARVALYYALPEIAQQTNLYNSL